ncbi:hypothetical protein [Natronolimnohabitans innermongolicus]|uniref:hypothetical protein n=1 Tax=Natronolimnohabitans innermongolicus TaxID=253107 RepID=UPI0012683C52|nr:hypothetical protein [Natronolimnohabitans innermongolicus]
MDIETALTIVSLSFLYIAYKRRSLNSRKSVEEEMWSHLQPEYHMTPGVLIQQFPGYTWPDEFYFTVWDVKVKERGSKMKKWLPGRGFQGTTQIFIEFHGAEPPIESKIDDPYYNRSIVTVKSDYNKRDGMKIIFQSVDADFVDRSLRRLANDITRIHLERANEDLLRNLNVLNS